VARLDPAPRRPSRPAATGTLARVDNNQRRPTLASSDPREFFAACLQRAVVYLDRPDLVGGPPGADPQARARDMALDSLMSDLLCNGQAVHGGYVAVNGAVGGIDAWLKVIERGPAAVRDFAEAHGLPRLLTFDEVYGPPAAPPSGPSVS
jgi:hypothetical protein